MRIIERLILGVALPLAITTGASVATVRPAEAQDVLQCVPYARAVSGISLHGDAWTWWDQARGRYERGFTPRAGAVLALANTGVMPLGHVAVVSKILDERHILLRHANWSGPGLIEKDVLAVDSSAENDWSQVRIWWGQSQQMGARDNPVNGFIYPRVVRDQALQDADTLEIAEAETPRPAIRQLAYRTPNARLSVDPALFVAGHDTALSLGQAPRTLAMIVRDVEREARLR